MPTNGINHNDKRKVFNDALSPDGNQRSNPQRQAA